MFEIIQGYKGFVVDKKRVLPKLARGVFNRTVLKRPHLRVAEIATTFLCNSECVMCSCSRLRNYEKEKNRMDVADYARLGKALDSLGCISVNVTGGEPLLRKDLSEIITALNPKNKILNVVTNGINLTKERIHDYSSLGVDSIVVSLESTDPGENDRVRGYPGHFKAVMNAIAWAKEEGVRFGISLTLGDFNFKKVYELLEFARDKSIFLCIAHGGSIGNWADNSAVRLSEENAKRILALIKRYKYMKIDFSANLNLRPGCPGIMEKIFITPYGDVLPCTFIPLSFGNLRREPLPVIWKRMIDFYRQNVRRKTLCMRTYDKEFIDKFLSPIKDLEQPVTIDKHPWFARERD